MSQGLAPQEDRQEDRKICFCHDVMLSRILKEIREGATTLEEIQRRTRASTGCGGCEFELLEILEAELKGE